MSSSAPLRSRSEACCSPRDWTPPRLWSSPQPSASPLQPALTSARPGVRNGQSWGKQLAGIRVVRDDGRPIGMGYALARETLLKTLLLFWIGALFLLIPWLIDVLWPLWDDQRRALHDTVVGTHVVGA